jgi:hypothetical protein
MTAVAVVNTLAKGWKVLEDNSKLDVSTQPANAIPEGAAWQDMTQGAGPNFFDWEWRGPGLVKADFWIHMRMFWTYGSHYKGGGAFISGAWPEIIDYNFWMPGYAVDISGAVRSTQMTGTDTAPVAQMAVAISIKYHWVSKTFADSGGTCMFELYGNGKGTAHWDDMSYDS